MKKVKVKILYVVAAILFILSGVFFNKGHYKMTRYYNSDYSSLNVNAYVGGDAYNYIINGNYATGFFVLGSGFLLSGSVFLCTGLVLSTISAQGVRENSNLPEPIKPTEEQSTLDVKAIPESHDAEAVTE